MTAQAQQQQFMEEYNALEKRFAAMTPELAITLEDPDLGVEGYIVVWNTGISANGPLALSGKGGTRITPTVTQDEVGMLARTMALKNAAAGLPLGGAKSGLRADPDAPGFEQKYRRFVQLAKPYLREHGGIFGGFGFDIGARPVHALWACDELQSTKSFTGKPVELGGTDYDREGIAGLGVATAAAAMLKAQGADAKDTRFAVQGLGAMGAAVVRYFSAQGGVLRAISDPRFGGTYIFDTPPDEQLLAAIARQDAAAVAAQLSALAPSPAEEVLYVQADVLFPCAVQNVLREDNAARVQSRAVVEGANGPLTEAARKILHEKGVTVVPDFIANPGGIIAAFVEMTLDVSAEENARTRAKVAAAKSMTVERISANVAQMLDIAAKNGVDTVTAGRYMAYRNIFA